MNDKLDTNYSMCYTKCKAGVTDYQLQIDGAIFPCVFINEPINEVCLNFSEMRANNNFMNFSIDEIVKNDFFDAFYRNLSNIDNFSHVQPCNTCPYSYKLDICRPCAHQHNIEKSNSPEFHRNLICKEILSKNSNNFYTTK